ncbi:Sec-independent protein translocase protein TatB [Gordonia sp. ABSL49_1]|uniref:Sec-independent protein translocase protein TatB n=1 Tax=unclassified Gordonia (in: high G+C Gram-positive bacteria) TaxID=2657482 RepID=UPI001F1158C3|nr:Sec-independent protein translocase protein TatB [Gordonia sp. ABSL49_1]MCH5643658.1 Sec-independent protein translocase protein TatB [Gordonia sp. ABSL49_1]
MFSSVGWGEIAILIVAGLIILGPERLPGAVSWTMKSLRQVRDYASGATSQLKEELGPDFEDLRKPLAELNELRGMTPRSIVTKHLLDGDDSVFRMASEATTFERDGDTPAIKPVSKPLPTDAPGVDTSKIDITKSGPSEAAPRPRSTERPSVTDWDAT